MPTWLQDQLVADGTMTPTFVTRKARTRRCKACGLTCLAAIDDLGLEAWADIAELTPEGELHATLAGRPTWLILGADLVARFAPDIANRPADRWRVVAAHVCGAAPLPAKPPKQTVAVKSNTPPF